MSEPCCSNARCSGRRNFSCERVIEHLEQGVEVPGNVENRDRLSVNAELGPAQHLEELLVGAESAGQCEEGVAVLVHHRLALVHRADHAELGDSAMGELETLDGAWG